MTTSLKLHQLSLPELCPITAAVHELATTGGVEARGAIFTRREVVDFILDLSGYTTDTPLHHLRLLEPSFGGADFLLPAIERLLQSWKSADGDNDVVRALGNCIRAVELHHETFIQAKALVIKTLESFGISKKDAHTLADCWLSQGDFLLADIPGQFDFVVGNPPYVRQELIPDVLMSEYRARYKTIYDRADLYIPFIERSLSHLTKGGNLGFICADRWMKNRYGGPLRQMVATGFHLKVYIDMTSTQAFLTDVIAYPAITVISRQKPGPTRIVHSPEMTRPHLRRLANIIAEKTLPKDEGAVREMACVTSGDEPWILESSDQMDLVRRLEGAFPLLEEAGCKVGIGVATGADKVFIAPFDTLDVEPDRKLPLAMTRDIVNGNIEWRGFGVINPFKDEGGLVDLEKYPRLRRYLETYKEVIGNRHVAKSQPSSWYRTIDRITPALAKKPKLLIPDIKGDAHVVYDNGILYPHHNLYFILSENWDMRALQAVLLSGIARLFVSVYSTKMRGGYLRFQAQYLRRIRIPLWKDVPEKLRKELSEAAEKQDIPACNRAVFKLYGLTPDELAALGGNGD
ncbi:Eco57I restriction-modification methylase domain-containing protein [Pseudomonas protegens]|uniref:Eco57I restriction-modification methylase domain-containing protein n=1 Tax=Pseudomonas protegens TaxID=380021 RepID=UPI000A72D830|nr:Eco57I restriction-modification methylase domain-containing protein [Pseudomonas protegens]